MTEYQKASIVLAMAEALRRNGSWTGETHLHKTVYFLEELLHVPADLQFVLYKHGPYSFDLLQTIGFLEANDFLQWKPQYPYGASALPGPASGQLKKLYPKTPKRYEPQIEFVASRLGARTVRELEKLATALWVTRHFDGVEVRERASRIHILKPHISLQDAAMAVTEIDLLADEANALGVIA